MLLASYFRVFGMQWYGFRAELPAIAIVSVLFGVGAAWFEWRREERRFQEASASGTRNV